MNERYVHPRTGYAFVRVPGHPRADIHHYVFEHLVVAEAALGRSIVEPHCVHHINHQRSDNRKCNLVICEDQAYHLLLHARERIVKRGGDPDVDWVCNRCRLLRSGQRFGAPGYCLDCYLVWLREHDDYKQQWRLRTGRSQWIRGRNLTTDQQDAIIEMVDRGMCNKDIAKEFSIVPSAVNWVKKRYGRPIRPLGLRALCNRGHTIVTLPTGRRVCHQCTARRQREYLRRLALKSGVDLGRK